MPVKVKRFSLVIKHQGYVSSRSVSNQSELAELAREYIGTSAMEKVVAFYADAAFNLLGCIDVSIGGPQNALVDPRPILQGALLCNASSIFLAHNHPSGRLVASAEDIAVTRRVKECAELLGFEFQDHVIVSWREHISLRERNPEAFRSTSVCCVD